MPCATEILSISKRIRARHFCIGAAILFAATAISGGAWFQIRYDTTPLQTVELIAFSNAEYPEDPANRSRVFGNYPHRRLHIQQTGETSFRFLVEPGSTHAATIELSKVDVAYFVAAVPPWVKQDQDLIKIGLIEREWNRQQVSFRRNSPQIQVGQDGDGFEFRALSRVDLARNCLNAGLWELLFFTDEDGEERAYDHVWFTFPLGLYKTLFEQVNGLSYWNYWWSLEHWVDPTGTPIPLNRLRTVEREWTPEAEARWTEAPLARGEQARKRKEILAPPIYTYRDWYTQPIQFATFIQPGRYSIAHPRPTSLHYLAEFTGARLRRVRLPVGSQALFELELNFRDSRTGQPTRLLFGGLDFGALPIASPARYEQGWSAPMGIGNPSVFEPYEVVIAPPLRQRTFYGFHLDAQDRWIDHHAVGVDGPLFLWDDAKPSMLHVYLLSYERHALLNHFVIVCPPDACPHGRI